MPDPCDNVRLVERVARLEAQFLASQDAIRVARDELNEWKKVHNDFKATIDRQVERLVTLRGQVSISYLLSGAALLVAAADLYFRH